MSLAALIARYKHPPVTPVTPVTAPALPLQAAPTLTVTPVTRVTPQNIEGQKQSQNPDALLLEIAATLQANPDHLYALLSTDDIQDIAEGKNSRAYMLDYFRLMRADGKLPVYKAPPPAKAAEPPQSHLESAEAWKPAHEAMMNHVVACAACCAPQSRYCNEGADLSRHLPERRQPARS